MPADASSIYCSIYLVIKSYTPAKIHIGYPCANKHTKHTHAAYVIIYPKTGGEQNLMIMSMRWAMGLVH
jgi:hypothetical protein